MNEFIWEFSRDRVRRLALRGLRVDRRKPFEYRPVHIETNIGGHADGSAFVQLGKTKVIAGVKFEIGEPYPDTPDKGALMTDAELLPLASPTFEPGPPDENAIELARVVDRSIRESKAIDLTKLVIEEGKLVYLVFVDLRVLDADGNLFDAASMAAVSALGTAKIPRVEDGMIVREEYIGRLQLNEIPLLTTFAKIGNAIFVDPTLEEEKAMDARLSVATVDDGSIVALQKGGEGAFTKAELDRMFEQAVSLGKNIRKIVREAIGYGKD